MYKHLLLDLDDTLIDYDYSTQYAFEQTLEKFNLKNVGDYKNFKQFELDYFGNIPHDKFIDKTKESYQIIKDLNAGLIAKFIDINLEKAYEIYDYYDSMLATRVRKTEEYDNEIIYLNEKYNIIISTNGNRIQAINKIKKINILSFNPKVFTAQECGFSKETFEYYELLFQKMCLKNKKEVLIIGDKLVSDIKGGNLYGMDTCWYNKKNEINNTNYVPTFEVKSFKELVKKI